MTGNRGGPMGVAGTPLRPVPYSWLATPLLVHREPEDDCPLDGGNVHRREQVPQLLQAVHQVQVRVDKGPVLGSGHRVAVPADRPANRRPVRGPGSARERLAAGVGDLVVLVDGPGADPDPAGDLAGRGAHQHAPAKDHQLAVAGGLDPVQRLAGLHQRG